MTKHAGMYPRARQQALDGEKVAVTDRNHLEQNLGDKMSPTMAGMISPSNLPDKISLAESGCMCAVREADEEEKEAIMAEIHLTYEEILQLEQALIEVDEQNTTNTLEIRKREAKMIFIMKQVEDIEDVLLSKENNTDAEQRLQYQDQANTLSK